MLVANAIEAIASLPIEGAAPMATMFRDLKEMHTFSKAQWLSEEQIQEFRQRASQFSNQLMVLKIVFKNS